MGIHTMKRALAEAADLNDWFNAADVHARMWFRTASFCMERSGHFDAFDQGIAFFLPNMTWLQPPGYVHKMITDTWAATGHNATVQTQASGQSASAQTSEDGCTLVLRYVNQLATPVSVRIAAAAREQESESERAWLPSEATVWTLASADLDGGNTPADPAGISPVKSTVNPNQPLRVPGQSYTVVTMQLKEAGEQ